MSIPIHSAGPAWHTSSYSSDQNCVEVAENLPEVLIRDSKDRAGSVLALPPSSWTEFVLAAQRGEFQL